MSLIPRSEFEITIAVKGQSPIVVGGCIPDSVFVKGEVPDIEQGRTAQKALEMALDQLKAMNAANTLRSG